MIMKDVYLPDECNLNVNYRNHRSDCRLTAVKEESPVGAYQRLQSWSSQTEPSHSLPRLIVEYQKISQTIN